MARKLLLPRTVRRAGNRLFPDGYYSPDYTPAVESGTTLILTHNNLTQPRVADIHDACRCTISHRASTCRRTNVRRLRMASVPR
jgi:hypothetical protein